MINPRKAVSYACEMAVEPVYIEAVGGTHDGGTFPMHPIALTDGSQLVVPSHVIMEAMVDAPEREPVTSGPDNTWERYVVRRRGESWVLEFDGRLDHLDPPAPPV
jgi:hypothetical protein